MHTLINWVFPLKKWWNFFYWIFCFNRSLTKFYGLNFFKRFQKNHLFFNFSIQNFRQEMFHVQNVLNYFFSLVFEEKNALERNLKNVYFFLLRILLIYIFCCALVRRITCVTILTPRQVVLVRYRLAFLNQAYTFKKRVGYVSAPPIRRRRFGSAVSALDNSAPGLFGARTFFFRFVVL